MAATQELLLGEGAGNAAPAYIENVFSTYIYTGNASSQTITNNINLLSTGSVATTGTFLSSGLAGVAVASDGSYAVIAANGVVKLTSADVISWQITDSAKTFKNCVFDSSGNLYVSAHTGTTVYVGKYNSSGTVQWFKSCVSSTPDDVLGMAITSDGNLFLGWGDTSGTAVSMKMSTTDGSITWQKLLTATSLKCQDVATDSSGNCYQLGYAGATRYPFIVKYDSSGNTTWQKQLATTDGTGGLFTYGIGVDSSANVFIACYAASGGTNKSWAVKLSSAGALSAQIGSTASNSVTGLTVDSSGNVYYTSNNSVFKYDNSLTSQWMRNIYSSPSRNGVKVVGSTVYVSTGGGLMLKLLVDGTTYEGFSDQLSSRYYSSPVDTTYPSTSISASTSTITFGNGSYTVGNSSAANNVTYTTVAQTFPAIVAGNGMVWGKTRSAIAASYIADTTRGLSYFLSSSSTSNQSNATNGITSSGSTGFTVGALGQLNGASVTQVAWTFKEQPKFFDVVTYTGDGTNDRNVAHNLGSVPGCMFIKVTSTTGDWWVYHRSLTSSNASYLKLNTTDARSTVSAPWNSDPTSTTFNVWNGINSLNANGVTYVAYLFAHDAGGFGLTGADNVISCGTYTGNGTLTGVDVSTGYETQFVLIKKTSAVSAWAMFDIMRGASLPSDNIGLASELNPNTTAAEATNNYGATPRATGFNVSGNGFLNTAGATYIYIAIRRGPMKVPTSGTTVFSPIASSASTGTVLTTGFPVDLQIDRAYSLLSNNEVVDRLRGISTNSTGSGQALYTNLTNAEASNAGSSLAWDNTGFQMNSNLGALNSIYWSFGRAPSFFDEVCYAGTGANRTVTHNLGVTPELMIVKSRAINNWCVYSSALGNTTSILLDSSAASFTQSTIWNNTTPSSSVFTVGTNSIVNDSATNYVAYLFATCPGVSKVGSYTGAGIGVIQQINCGFTAGARLVIIKRTDATGGWYIFDTARGIVAGNDPYMFLNTNAAQVSTDYLDPYAAGFEISDQAPAGMNAVGGTYIYLAIA